MFNGLKSLLCFVQVYDGIMLDTCKAIKNDNNTYTYNAGVLVGALVEEYKVKRQQRSLYLAHNISLSILRHMTKE